MRQRLMTEARCLPARYGRSGGEPGAPRDSMTGRGSRARVREEEADHLAAGVGTARIGV
jgi:hypothetical protein